MLYELPPKNSLFTLPQKKHWRKVKVEKGEREKVKNIHPAHPVSCP